MALTIEQTPRNRIIDHPNARRIRRPTGAANARTAPTSAEQFAFEVPLPESHLRVLGYLTAQERAELESCIDRATEIFRAGVSRAFPGTDSINEEPETEPETRASDPEPETEPGNPATEPKPKPASKEKTKGKGKSKKAEAIPIEASEPEPETESEEQAEGEGELNEAFLAALNMTGEESEAEEIEPETNP